MKAVEVGWLGLSWEGVGVETKNNESKIKNCLET